MDIAETERWVRKKAVQRAAATNAMLVLEQFFGFTCNDAEGAHLHKQGAGEGDWFRLKDGRVFDGQARPDEPEPANNPIPYTSPEAVFPAVAGHLEKRSDEGPALAFS